MVKPLDGGDEVMGAGARRLAGHLLGLRQGRQGGRQVELAELELREVGEDPGLRVGDGVSRVVEELLDKGRVDPGIGHPFEDLGARQPEQGLAPGVDVLAPRCEVDCPDEVRMRGLVVGVVAVGHAGAELDTCPASGLGVVVQRVE